MVHLDESKEFQLKSRLYIDNEWKCVLMPCLAEYENPEQVVKEVARCAAADILSHVNGCSVEDILSKVKFW